MYLRHRTWFAEQEALRLGAALAAQQLKLHVIFDSLRGGSDAEALAEPDHRVQNKDRFSGYLLGKRRPRDRSAPRPLRLGRWNDCRDWEF